MFKSRGLAHNRPHDQGPRDHFKLEVSTVYLEVSRGVEPVHSQYGLPETLSSRDCSHDDSKI